MARPLRLEFAGALYHVTSWGDGREDIYRSDGDRKVFLDVLAGVRARYNWTVHAYCLMTNHYLLLVETPDANLAKGMRQLKQQVFLGSDAFVAAMRREVPTDKDLRAVPQARAPHPRSRWPTMHDSTRTETARSLRPTPAVAIPCARSATTSVYTTPASVRSCRRPVQRKEGPRFVHAQADAKKRFG